MNIGTRIFTALNGKLVGRDADGNRYYESRSVRPGQRMRRWVIYAGAPEASKVPPEWHAWLHHMVDEVPAPGQKYPWELPHQPNLTGTPLAYHPHGSVLRGGQRVRARRASA